jgi:hypothetical protein
MNTDWRLWLLLVLVGTGCAHDDYVIFGRAPTSQLAHRSPVLWARSAPGDVAGPAHLSPVTFVRTEDDFCPGDEFCGDDDLGGDEECGEFGCGDDYGECGEFGCGDDYGECGEFGCGDDYGECGEFGCGEAPEECGEFGCGNEYGGPGEE